MGRVQNQVVRAGLIENMAVEVKEQTMQIRRSNVCKGPEVGGQYAWNKVNERMRRR